MPCSTVELQLQKLVLFNQSGANAANQNAGKWVCGLAIEAFEAFCCATLK